MAETVPTEYFIQGVTSSGKTFRPSDWCERLCGVMSGFGPGKRGPNARLQYSIYVRPTLLGNVKTVILDSRLRDIEPMAFDFVMNFAKDNDLLVTEACELPPHHAKQQGPLRRPLFDAHDKKPAISGFFIAAFCCLLLPFAVLSVRTNRNRNQS